MFDYNNLRLNISVLSLPTTNKPGLFITSDSYAYKKQRILGSWLQQSAHCVWKNDICPIPWSPDYGVSGLPCEDMSICGARRKREGPTNAVWITHGKFCQNREVKMMTIECTPEARPDLHYRSFVYRQSVAVAVAVHCVDDLVTYY
jgi:hypothetical protein